MNGLHPLARVALGVTQGLLIVGVAWILKTQWDQHDVSMQQTSAIELLTYKLSEVQKQGATLQEVKSRVTDLQYQVDDLQKRQSKDDAYRDAHPR